MVTVQQKGSKNQRVVAFSVQPRCFDESHSSDDEEYASLIYRRYKQRHGDLCLGHRRGRCDTVNRRMTDT